MIATTTALIAAAAIAAGGSVASGVIGYFGLAALSPETFYPISKIGLVSVFTWAFTSDSLLNGEIKPKE